MPPDTGSTADSENEEQPLVPSNEPRLPTSEPVRLRGSRGIGNDVALGPPTGDDIRPVSFKRRTRDVSLGLASMRRWMSRDSRASSFARQQRGSMAGADWEHPARYVNASCMTVPTILPTATPSTPIPMLPFTVLCLLIFGEFCSSGVSGPFLYFMIDGFQIGDESRVGFWAGIVAATFFFAQFLTSLLWQSAAERHGRLAVLRVSLVGNTLALVAFGLSPNLGTAMLTRFLQGFFNGAVGVAKGAVRDLTDESNESRAYAQMGFYWGMGGIVGPILGGILEHPAEKYTWLLGNSAFLRAHPYVLPCIVAASFTCIGAVLSLFLDTDVRPAQGPVHLETEDQVRSPSMSTLRRGTAYGYGRQPSVASSFARSYLNGMPQDSNLVSDSEVRMREHRLSLMERFVLSNDDTVLSLTDLWVAAASAEDPEPSVELEADAQASDVEDSVDDEEPTALFGSSFVPGSRTSSGYVPPAHFARRMRGQSAALANAEAPNAVVEGSTASLWETIPLLVVAHYTVLAFHSTMFDQVFMSFLVTAEPSGGLGLTAGHYAILIASMALCQLLFQFRVYPNLGPPYGALTHLAVLQLGMMLYLPCYVLFPLLRTFLLPSTDALVMAAMILFATLRWLANVLSFTSVMVLLNAWTPPHLVPLANGIAQTASSAARFCGPIIGGIVWGQSISGGPNAHPWPFNFHLGFWVVGLVAATGALHARFIKDM